MNKKIIQFKIVSQFFNTTGISEEINKFIENNNVTLVDVKYNFIIEDGKCFESALVIYRDLPPVGTRKVNGRLIKPNNKGDE